MVIGAIWNLVAWVWFARAYKLSPLMFLGIPFLTLAAIYGWFTLADVPLHVRAEWVRANVFMVVYAQAPVLSLLAWLKGRKK